MRKLPFHILFTGFTNLDFISCFSSVYLFLENRRTGKEDYECTKKNGLPCTGCRNCRYSLHGLMENTFFYFDTMAGRSSLRCHFNGEKTDMQLWIGETQEDGCGTDETVDFLFGFAGYDYKKVTRAAGYTAEIIASLNGGRPVLACVSGDKGRYRVIIGYDGDRLMEPDYSGAQDKPDCQIVYGDIRALYIIGERIPGRFSIVDGLKWIVKVMDYNTENALWDEYMQKMGWRMGSMGHADSVEQSALMKRTVDTMWHTFNSHNFAEVFRNRMFDDLKHPAFDEVENNMWRYGYTHDLAWSLIGLNDIIKWNQQWEGIRCGYAEMIELTLRRIKENDIQVLACIKAALALIETENLIIRKFQHEDWKDLQENSVSNANSEFADCDVQWPVDDKVFRLYVIIFHRRIHSGQLK